MRGFHFVTEMELDIQVLSKLGCIVFSTPQELTELINEQNDTELTWQDVCATAIVISNEGITVDGETTPASYYNNNAYIIICTWIG